MAKCACTRTSSEVRLSGRTVYRGGIMNVEEDSVLLPSGRTATREVVRTRDSVSCGIIDGEGRVCLIRQYRYPAGRLLWEIPAGRIEPGEEPADAAVREAGEETALACSVEEKVAGFFLAAGFATEFMHMYLMKVTGESDAVPDEDEAIEAGFFTPQQAMSMMQEGEIADSKTLIFLNWYLRRLGL
ncbi:MAG TPA: NUDIX hydrolase [Bacillota bacterium]|nr:NUDIX hydrolase [Bacillota bacterium]HOG53030.1 NUDIX hydrolase [Bacillota bacterium]